MRKSQKGGKFELCYYYFNTIIGSFEVRVSCGSTDPANRATSDAFPTVVHNDMVVYIPCQNGEEAFFDGFGG